MRQLATISLLLIYLLPAVIAGNPGFPFRDPSGQALDAGSADRSVASFAPLPKKISNREVSKHPLPLNVRSYPCSHVFISMIPSENALFLLFKEDTKAINITGAQRFSSGCLRHIWQPPRFIYTT